MLFSERKFTFPTVPVISKLQTYGNIDRFWSLSSGHIESNFGTYYRLNSPEGYDSFFIQRYGELITSVGTHGKYVKDIPRADAVIPNLTHISEVTQDKWRMRILSLLGVKYILTPNSSILNNDKTVENTFNPIWTDGIYTIYQYLQVTPRTFITDKFVIQKQPQKILDWIFDPKTDITRTIQIEKSPTIHTNGFPLVAAAKILLYHPNTVTIQANTNKESFLFLSDAYFPGWKATVDGKETQIYRADYAFRAIQLQPGKHMVSFIYDPQSWHAGIFVSCIGILALGIVIVVLYKKNEKS